MSIQSNYEINVAKDGRHYCKIELGWCFKEVAIEKFNELRELFGSEYKLDLTYWECLGHHVEGR